jgi:hypothetical protein
MTAASRGKGCKTMPYSCAYFPQIGTSGLAQIKLKIHFNALTRFLKSLSVSVAALTSAANFSTGISNFSTCTVQLLLLSLQRLGFAMQDECAVLIAVNSIQDISLLVAQHGDFCVLIVAVGFEE